MNYLQEWQASCVDPKIVQLNVIPVAGKTAQQHLLYAETLLAANGEIHPKILQRYQHIEQGGWWCSGIDLLTGECDAWGCLKPLLPRQGFKRGKTIKYEHPPKQSTGVFALRLPLQQWRIIAQRYQVELLESDIDSSVPDLGFWQWVAAHPEIPLCITEGAKKAGCLLSAGYVAVALPGVNSGYRAVRNRQGKRIGKSHLIPQLQKLATAGREIYIVFDQDTRPKTVKAVNTAIRRLGYLLIQQQCSVKIVTWQSDTGKGVDDLIAAGGQLAFERAYANALSLATWKAQTLYELTYPSQINLSSRYLENLAVTDEKLVAIKSPKGTGKTEYLRRIVTEAIANRQPILVIGHRIRLVEQLCQRFGIAYGTNSSSKGMGLCIDSLHPNSAVGFEPQLWQNALIIIDEVEQVIWHMLNSDTCKGNRVAILKTFKTLLQNSLDGRGKLYVADADLSDLSLDYLISLAGIPLKPWIINNRWQPTAAEAWQVYHYPDSTPKKLVKDLVRYIWGGGKPIVFLSAQKFTSRWSTCTLEAYLKQQFSKLKILRLDSQSMAEPTHSAYGGIDDRLLREYDIVLASPAIETGISIESHHFTSVWGIAGGVQDSNAVRQALARVRQPVPRYLWLANYGFNSIGNGSTSIPALLTCGQRVTQYNIKLLQQADFAAVDDIDTGFQAESLLCWAKMAVRVNAAMNHYRETIINALRKEGHRITTVTRSLFTSKTRRGSKPKQANSLTQAIASVQAENYTQQCQAIANARPLTEGEYHQLKRMGQTNDTRNALRKYELAQRYGLEVTTELVALDDRHWYTKLRLHYFLTVGRAYLPARESAAAEYLLQQGQGSLFLPDFNASQLGATVAILELLQIPSLLQTARLLDNADAQLQAIATTSLAHRREIKAATGVGLATNASPITIVGRFLGLIGHKLQHCHSRTHNSKRLRVYQIQPPQDSREQVFAYWRGADALLPGSSEFSGRRHRFKSQSTPTVNPVQLHLDLS